MDPTEITPPLQRRVWLDRLQAIFEILLMSGVFSSFVAAAPLAIHSRGTEALLRSVRTVASFVLLESGVTFVLLALILRAHGETLADLGLRLNRWRGQILVGIAIVPCLFLLNALVGGFFRIFLPKYFMERNPLMEIILSPRDLILFITSALIAGGVKEELQRAFIIVRFRQHLGGAWLGLVLWSMAFGAGHYVQGLQGMVVAGLFGLVFGAVYVLRANLIGPMISHGLYDALALLGYWYFRG
ncbi:MAG TPA: CPBP family intramembrane glutamic endopeptidase [Acidobacteriota bacterium]|nr:CPBP family intramembrane glutamic endopeptidase [Acidobacteriota bacterium]